MTKKRKKAMNLAGDILKRLIKEVAIWLYLTTYRYLFLIMSIFPLKNKITFIVSFGDNSLFLYEEMKRQQIQCDTVFLYSRSCKYNLKFKDAVSIKFETLNLINIILSIYHIATSRTVIIDNYYAFLSVVNFKKNVKCIQVWHAAGAFKKFGLKDHSIKDRNRKDIKRFKNVYKRFSEVIVGSDIMGQIFQEAFDLSASQILRVGIPRTDIFFNEQNKQLIVTNILNKFPYLKNKKRILYAPTFRDESLDSFELRLDLDLMKEKLGKDYVILLRLHPAIRNELDIRDINQDFVFDFSDYVDVNEILMITDILITDYSSIPFEYSLLKRPMIFFAYDLEEYIHERGVWFDYKEMIPGPLALTTTEIIDQIRNNSFNLEEIEAFSDMWNKYSTGQSSQQLIHYLSPFIQKKEQREKMQYPG